MKPWEKYQSTTEPKGSIKPWEKYQEPITTEQTQEPSYLDKVGDIVSKRQAQLQEIEQRSQAGEMGELSRELQTGGAYAGGLMDVAGQTVMSGLEAIGDLPLPGLQSYQQAAIPQLEALGESQPVQLGMQALQAGGEMWEGFRQQYPDVARNIEATVNIAGLVPSGYLGKALGKEARMAGKGVQETAELAGRGVRRGAQEAIAYPASKIIPSIAEETADVAKLAKKYKIPVTVTEIADSPTLTTAQKISGKLLGSGEPAYRAKQMSSFNKALLDTVGVKSDKITPMTMDKAFTEVGRKFEKFGKGKVFNFDDDFVRGLNDIKGEISEAYGREIADAFDDTASKLLNKTDDMRNIKGEILNRERARVNKLARKATDPARAEAFRDLENYIIEKMTETPEAMAELRQAKQQYKNLLTIEPLAAKAKGGNINPTQLANRVKQVYGRSFVRGKAGDIGELARVGLEILPVPGGSDTAERLFFAGGAVGVGADPATVTGVLGANRAYQELINRNPALVRRLLEGAQ